MEEPGGTATQLLKIRTRTGAKGCQPPPISPPALEEDDRDEGSGAEGHGAGGEGELGDLLESVRLKKTPCQIPPGGILVTSGVPDESVPTMEGLRIEQYSNDTYWKFAPYLELVRCETGSLICQTDIAYLT
jgi:hypothetical protein